MEINFENATYEEKREYLNQYYKKKNEEKNFLLELETINELNYIPKQVITGMPSAHENKDLSDLFVRLEEKKQEYIKCRYKAAMSACRIIDKINKMKDEEMKQILIMRHIRFYSWEKIGLCLGYSRAGTYKKYRAAVNNFPLKIKCRHK